MRISVRLIWLLWPTMCVLWIRCSMIHLGRAAFFTTEPLRITKNTMYDHMAFQPYYKKYTNSILLICAYQVASVSTIDDHFGKPTRIGLRAIHKF